MKRYRISTEVDAGSYEEARRLAAEIGDDVGFSTTVEDLSTPQWTCNARYNGLEHGFSVQADDFEEAMAVAFDNIWKSDIAGKGEPNSAIRELHLDVKAC